jgi:hypothetical protein
MTDRGRAPETQPLERAGHYAASLYQLAFLLTGDRAWSLDVTLEALDSRNGANSFFSNWMLAWSRRLVIAKALAGIRDDLVASARRTASQRIDRIVPPSRNWALDPETTVVQIERALLAIDVFPRCALLLTLFEEVSLEDTAVLLDEDCALIRKAQVVGLRELTRNLARLQC